MRRTAAPGFPHVRGVPGPQAGGCAKKSGPNRADLGKGWHRLELALRNAARKTGTRVVPVNPAYTSQTCHRCKVVDAHSRKSRAEFACTACEHTDHADVNAAKGILHAAGHAMTVCGDLAVGRSVKQEPASARAGAPTGVVAGRNPPALAVGEEVN
ncbi:MAG TPA: transposase [Nocardiopsis listeri]|nr:transposase [Nocardiopsis listeri]